MGYDIGSRYLKICLLKDSKIQDFIIAPTTKDIKKNIKVNTSLILKRNRIRSWKIKNKIFTGIGSKYLNTKNCKITEEACLNKAISSINNEVKTIVNIGGLFIQAITLNHNGSIDDIVENEKCTSGSGRFLEVISNSMNTPLSSFSQIKNLSDSPHKITNSCSVFAESEIISLINSGKSKEEVLHSALDFITTKTISILNTIDLKDKIALTGGVANLDLFPSYLADKLGKEFISLPINPQLVIAYGAALHGQTEN